MSPGIHADPPLKPASLPGAPASLGAVEAPLVRAAPAGAHPFLLEGDRVAVSGSERAGAGSFRIDGRIVAGALRTDAGPAAGVVVAPATIRRELAGARGSVIERLFALPALPLVAAQWEAPAGAPDLPGLTLELTLLPGGRDPGYRADADGVRVADADGSTVVDVVVYPRPRRWSAAPDDDGGVRVRATLGGARRVTLLLASGTPDAVRRALAAAPHLASHEIRAAAASDIDKVDTLVTRTGVREVDDAVLWATTRLRAALRRGGGAGADRLFWSGAGAVAVGDDESALQALTLLGDPGGGGPGSVLLAARYALASGDQEPALACLSALAADPSVPTAGEGWPTALATLADALRHAAPEAELDALRRPRTPARSAPGGGIRLPVIGGGSLAAGAAWWPGHPPEPGGHEAGTSPTASLPDELAAWRSLREGRTDEGWAGWRRALSHGLAEGPAGRGTWDPATEPWEAGAPLAGMLLATLAHGLLGLEPDAPAGRLRLAPALPHHIRSFSARNIRLAEARVVLDYRREEGLHRFRLEPVGGRVPVMAVFEPSLPVATVASVRVDGADAGLERSSEGGRTRLRVQLPLDRERTLEVEEG